MFKDVKITHPQKEKGQKEKVIQEGSRNLTY